MPFTNSTSQHLAAQITFTTPSEAAANETDVVVVTVPGAAIGDIVLAAPQTALPANQVFVGAYATGTNQVTFVFSSTGAATGASRVFNVEVHERFYS